MVAEHSKASSIQEEIKQTKPFSSVEEEALLALMRTADQVGQRNAEILKPFGLSPTQYNALRILRGGGEKGLPCSEIAVRMINHDPDITRLLDRLAKRGLVDRSREEKDRRVVTARITQAGLELLSSMDRTMRESPKQMLAGIGEKRLQSLLRLLRTVREKIA